MMFCNNIPPRAREIFLRSILKYANTKSITNKTKLKINWNKIKGLPFANHMIKQYLVSHLKSGFLEVGSKDWSNVIHLGTQQFVSKGRNISAVVAYNDARKRK